MIELKIVPTIFNEYDVANIFYLRGRDADGTARSANEVVVYAIAHAHRNLVADPDSPERYSPSKDDLLAAFNTHTSPHRPCVTNVYMSHEKARMVEGVREAMKLETHIEAISCALEFHKMMEQNFYRKKPQGLQQVPQWYRNLPEPEKPSPLKLSGNLPNFEIRK